MQKRILLIDDDELILIAMEELFGSEGLAVTTASSGKEGLDKASRTRFDIVVTDVIMPGMQGFDACKALRRMEAYEEVPIVMLTAKSGEADRKRGLDAGADLFLPKPIDPARLLALAMEALAG